MTGTGDFKSAVTSAITSVMDTVMNEALSLDPLVKKRYRSTHPFEAALLPQSALELERFLHHFRRPIQQLLQDLAARAANDGLGYGIARHNIRGTVKKERLRRISEVLYTWGYNAEQAARTRPDWDTELAYILAGDGPAIPVTVICDVYAEDRTRNLRYAFELKAPLPNSDQTKVSKEKILKLYSMEPLQVDGAYYALPYNPYGRREDYNWGFPARWFDMKLDPVVLIGNEFWDKIGGLGTYQSFITAVNEIGPAYKERIYHEFLGIEPPPDAYEVKL